MSTSIFDPKLAAQIHQQQLFSTGNLNGRSTALQVEINLDVKNGSLGLGKAATFTNQDQSVFGQIVGAATADHVHPSDLAHITDQLDQIERQLHAVAKGGIDSGDTGDVTESQTLGQAVAGYHGSPHGADRRHSNTHHHGRQGLGPRRDIRQPAEDLRPGH